MAIAEQRDPVRVSVMIDKETKRQLKILSGHNNMTMAEYIEHIVDYKFSDFLTDMHNEGK